MYAKKEKSLKLANLLIELKRELSPLSEDDIISLFSGEKTKISYSEIIEAEVTSLLDNLGMKASLMGYQYLKYAFIWIANQKPKKIKPSILYNVIANEFDSSYSVVERGLRYVIHSAYSIENEAWNELFPALSEPPENGFFISRVKDYLSL